MHPLAPWKGKTKQRPCAIFKKKTSVKIKHPFKDKINEEKET